MWDYQMTAARAQDKREEIAAKEVAKARDTGIAAAQRRMVEHFGLGCRTSGLSAISYANGFTLWHYRTDDNTATVLAPGYFDPAAQMLRQGDFMFVNARVNGPNAEHGVLVVLGNDAARVSVACVTGVRFTPIEGATA